MVLEKLVRKRIFAKLLEELLNRIWCAYFINALNVLSKDSFFFFI